MSIRVLSHVLEHSPVASKGDLLALIVLADHAHDDGGGAYPSVQTIARKARLSERGARMALRNLEAAGHISRDGIAAKGMTIYRVSMSDPPATIAPGNHCPPATTAREGGNQRSVPPAAVAPEPSIEPSENRPTSADAFPDDLPAEKHAAALQVHATLTRVAVSKPKARPVTLAAVGRAVASFPTHDHVEVANDVEHYWCHGYGQAKTLRDVVQTYRNRLRDLPAPVVAAVPVNETREQRRARMVAQTRAQNARLYANQPGGISDYDRAAGLADGGTGRVCTEDAA